MDSTTVTTVANPSGTAATARLTAIIKVSNTTFRWKSPALSKENTKMNTLIPSTSQLKIRLNWASLICKGVWLSSAWDKIPAIFPISVSMPVPVMMARPRPYTTVLPI